MYLIIYLCLYFYTLCIYFTIYKFLFVSYMHSSNNLLQSSIIAKERCNVLQWCIVKQQKKTRKIFVLQEKHICFKIFKLEYLNFYAKKILVSFYAFLLLNKVFKTAMKFLQAFKTLVISFLSFIYYFFTVTWIKTTTV